MENTELFKQITAKMAETYEKKNADYGNSFEETLNKWGINIALARMDDKLNRVNTLLNKTAQVKDESVEDTLMDLATYAVMTLMFLQKSANQETNTAPAKESEEPKPNFDYLIGKLVLIKGGVDSKGFPVKKVYGTIEKIIPASMPNSTEKFVQIYYNNVINSRNTKVGSGSFSSIYPINDLRDYGLDKETISHL